MESKSSFARDRVRSSCGPATSTSPDDSSSLQRDPEPSHIPPPSPRTRDDASSIRKWSGRFAAWSTPPWCRYHPEKPFAFPMSLNLLFAFAACFTVANLYYSHPVLNLIAKDFRITNEQASHIPTLAQAGYAVGLLFLCPLGDILRRRPFILCLIFITSALWIGLCVTKSFVAFQAITFVSAVTTVTPQLMVPLVGELAPAHRKASSLSIVTGGLLLGLLLARVLSGVVTRFIGWRYIYLIGLGLQFSIFILLWLFMPDYPGMNKKMPARKLPVLVWDVIKSPVQYPIMAQTCIIQFCASACFGNFWTTLVFLLSGPPYHYSALTIGLFALIGIGTLCWGPVFARLVMDKKQPLFSTIVGLSISLVGIVIGTYTGTHTIAGPIIEASTIEIGLLTTAIANRTAIFAQAPKATNRVNTAYMFTGFVGQLCGTAIGNAVFASSGWVASGSVGVGFALVALAASLARGPHEKGWVGWGGGCDMSRTPPTVTQDVEGGAAAAEGQEMTEDVIVVHGDKDEKIQSAAIKDIEKADLGTNSQLKG